MVAHVLVARVGALTDGMERNAIVSYSIVSMKIAALGIKISSMVIGPCQDVFKSCDRWKEEGRCDWDDQTKYFDDHCPHTCGNCVYDNKTSTTGSMSRKPPAEHGFF